jgi:ferredoxin
MTFVVTDACVQCKYTDCVEVCPVDCFMEGPNFLVIDPNGCIDCGVCAPECPVEAIFAEEDLTPEMQPYLAINAEIAGSGRWPVITLKKDPHPEHETHKAIKGKLHLLERSGV